MEKALQLIQGEIGCLKEAAKLGKLDEKNTTALIRYSDALLKYVKDGIGQEEEETKQAKKVSTEDLIAAAKKLAEKEQNK